MPTHVEYARKQHKATREAVGWRSRGYLPHFDVPGLVQMLTFRLADALPRTVVQALALDPRYRSDSARRERIQEHLDAGHGACYLRDPEIAELVQGALLHFDDERYHLLAWSVMPNHVHVLVEMLPGFPLDRVAHSWKSFTANQANRRLGRSGSFWQVEYFDRYIRDATHLRNAIAYIHGNVSRFSSAPVSAG